MKNDDLLKPTFPLQFISGTSIHEFCQSAKRKVEATYARVKGAADQCDGFQMRPHYLASVWMCVWTSETGVIAYTDPPEFNMDSSLASLGCHKFALSQTPQFLLTRSVGDIQKHIQAKYGDDDEDEDDEDDDDDDDDDKDAKREEEALEEKSNLYDKLARSVNISFDGLTAVSLFEL